MVNWKTPEVELQCAMIYTKMVIFLLGTYSWFILEGWHVVEGALITRQTKFALVHIPYLIARYGQLTTLVLICMSTQLPSIIASSCHFIAMTHATTIIGNIALVAASANLGLRAYIIWKSYLIVRVVIVLGLLGHLGYATLVGVVSVQAARSVDRTECVIVAPAFPKVTIGFFMYSIVLDTFIFFFTVLGLRKTLHNTHPASNSAMLHALKAQGVGYAAVTWLTSIPVAIALLLDLNRSMNIFFGTAGITVSTIASSKMVVSLLKLKNGEREGGIAGPDGHSLDTNPDLLTTNIYLTEFNPDSGGIESVSMDKKNTEEV